MKGRTLFSEKELLRRVQESLGFIPLKKGHFPLLYQWLNLPAQRRWYGNGQKVSWKEVEEKYTSYCQRFKEEEGQKKPLWAFIITFSNMPIGFIQFYDARDFKRDFGEFPAEIRETIKNCAALDFYIGDPAYLGRGLAPLVLQKFLKDHVWKQFSACFVDPDRQNTRACKAYAKVGFKELAWPEKTLPFLPLILKKPFSEDASLS